MHHKNPIRNALLLALSALVIIVALGALSPGDDTWENHVGELDNIAPSWLNGPLAHTADLGLLILAGIFGWAMWIARRHDLQSITTGLIGGLGVVIAYGISEVAKVFIEQDRPCRDIETISTCPEVGDWSFPSNHATLAFAMATTVILMKSPWWRIALPIAVIVAGTRVVEGAHYPHDVIAGGVLGTAVVIALVLFFAQPAGRFVSRAAQWRFTARLLTAQVSHTEPLTKDQTPIKSR